MTTEKIKSDLSEIKQLLLLGAKTTFSVGDVAMMLGVTPQTIYRLVQQKRIACYKSKGVDDTKSGKMVYFKREDIEAFCFAERKCSEQDIAELVKSIRG